MSVDFRGEFEESVFRALGQFDLNPLSQTYGCGDRSYWHYLDQKGFPVASFQVAMLAFKGAALLLPSHAPVFEAAVAASLQWWKQRVLSGCRIDEYFFGQKSFCATAYTTMTAAVLYRKYLATDSELGMALDAALDFLENKAIRQQSANQFLAARLATDLFRENSPSKNPFEPPQDSETGFLTEYGGFDLGYTLKCLDLSLLALMTLETSNARKPYLAYIQRLLDSLDLLVGHFRFPPELGSRNNHHRLLGGLSVFAGFNTKARLVLELLSDRSQYPDLVSPLQADDKYLSFFHVNSLLIGLGKDRPLSSLFALNGEDAETLRTMTTNSVEQDSLALKALGIYLKASPKHTLCISLRNGGAYSVHDESSLVTSVHGSLFIRGNRTFHTHVDLCGQETYTEDGIQVPIAVIPLTQKVRTLQNPIIAFLLRAILCLPFISSIARRFIYDRMKSSSEKPTILGVREFRVVDHRFEISERMNSNYGERIYFNDWSMVDGHATRLWGRPRALFWK